MFCTNCGNQINAGAMFCTNCGARVAEAATAPAPAIQQPVAGPVVEPVVAATEPAVAIEPVAAAEPAVCEETACESVEEPREREYEYKVLSKNDEKLSNAASDPAALERALNYYAGYGWRIVNCFTESAGFGSGKHDYVVILERKC